MQNLEGFFKGIIDGLEKGEFCFEDEAEASEKKGNRGINNREGTGGLNEINRKDQSFLRLEDLNQDFTDGDNRNFFGEVKKEKILNEIRRVSDLYFIAFTSISRDISYVIW